MEKPILKHLTIPELLDKVLQLYKRYALLLMAIGGVIFIPSVVIQSASLLLWDDARIVDGALGIFLSPFAELAIVVAISNLYLGKSITIQEAFSTGAKRYWSQIGSSFLIGLAIIPIALGVIIFSLGGPVLSFISLLLFIPLAVFLTTRWSLAIPVIVLEDVGAQKGLARSWELTKEYFWRVFGTSFAAGLLATLLSTLPYLLVTFFLSEIIDIPTRITLIITAILEKLAVIITAPFTLGVNVLIYYDLRIRKEGFDLMLMSEEQSEDSDDL